MGNSDLSQTFAAVLLANIFWPIIAIFAAVLFIVRAIIQFALNIFYKNKYTLINGSDALFGYKIPGNSSVIHSISVINGKPDLDLIRKRYAEHVFKFTEGKDPTPIYSKLKKIVSYKWGFYCWKESGETFDLKKHVRYVPEIGPNDVVSEDKLFQLLGNMMDQSGQMKEDKPQWEHLIVPNFRFNHEPHGAVTKHFVCIYRVHHSYTDGASIGILTNAVLVDKPLKFAVNPMKPFRGATPLMNAVLYTKAFLYGPLTFLLTLKSAITDSSPFCVNPYSNKKILHWSEPINMKLLRAIKRQSGASMPSIIVTCITGGLKKIHMKNFSEKEPIASQINIAVLGMMLPYKNRQLQNRFTTFSIPYPLSEDNITKRLEISNQAGNKVSYSTEPWFNFFVVRFAGCLPKVLQDLLLGMAGTPVMLSNIPGVVQPFKLFGGLMIDAGAWLPLLRVAGLAIAVYSYCDTLRICVTAESQLFANQTELKKFLNDVEMELNKLAKSYKINPKYL